MDPVTIIAPGGVSKAIIAVAYGFNCYEFVATTGGREIEVLASESEFVAEGAKPSHSGIPLLLPFPNRIREGKYTFEGREYELPADLVKYAGPNAIHGFAVDRPWRVTEKTESSVTGEFRLSVDAPERLPLWPSDFVATVTYSLSGTTLRGDVTIANSGDDPLPFGFGTHAYFKLPLGEGGDAGGCLVEAPAESRWLLEGGLPTGEKKSVEGDVGYDLRPPGAKFGPLKLDDVYTDVAYEDGELVTRVTDPAAKLAVVQRTDGSFREIVAFTPPWFEAVCLEPYTCATDAINLQAAGHDAGWRVLGPGESWSGWFTIAVEPTTD